MHNLLLYLFGGGLMLLIDLVCYLLPSFLFVHSGLEFGHDQLHSSSLVALNS